MTAYPCVVAPFLLGVRWRIDRDHAAVVRENRHRQRLDPADEGECVTFGQRLAVCLGELLLGQLLTRLFVLRLASRHVVPPFPASAWRQCYDSTREWWKTARRHSPRSPR